MHTLHIKLLKLHLLTVFYTPTVPLHAPIAIQCIGRTLNVFDAEAYRRKVERVAIITLTVFGYTLKTEAHKGNACAQTPNPIPISDL